MTFQCWCMFQLVMLFLLTDVVQVNAKVKPVAVDLDFSHPPSSPLLTIDSNIPPDDGLIRIKKNSRVERQATSSKPAAKNGTVTISRPPKEKNSTTTVPAKQDQALNGTSEPPNTVEFSEDDLKQLEDLDRLISSNETQKILSDKWTPIDNSTLAKLNEIENELKTHNLSDIWTNNTDIAVTNKNDKMTTFTLTPTTKSARRQEDRETHNKKRMDIFYMSLMAWICVAGFGLLVGLLVGLLIFGSE